VQIAPFRSSQAIAVFAKYGSDRMIGGTMTPMGA
jgi:hypothetical protein